MVNRTNSFRLIALATVAFGISSSAMAMTPRDQIIAQQMDLVEGVPLTQFPQETTVKSVSPAPVPVQVVSPQTAPQEVGQTPPVQIQPQAESSQEEKSSSSMEESNQESKNLEKGDKPAVRVRRHTFDMGADVYYNRYNERAVDVFLVGTMVGYYGTYTYRPPQGNFLNNNVFNMYRFEGHYASGKLDYKGSGIDKGQTNKMYELRGLAGKDYILADGSRVTPYFGFGYRFLFDHGEGRFSSDGHIGYDRESNYFYVPIGVYVDIPMTKNREVSFNLEYDWFLQGVQKSELSGIQPFTSGLTQDARNHQNDGFGVRGSVRFLKHYSPFDVYVEPFVRYWNIEDSKVIDLVIEDTLSSGLEPHNTTTEVGSKFGIQF